MRLAKKLHGHRFVSALTILAVFISLIVLPPQNTAAMVKGDGLLMYGEGTVQNPRYRSWYDDSNSFTAEANAPSAGATIHQVQMATSPLKQEAIAAVTQSALTNQLRVYHYNGDSWTLDWQATSGFNSSGPRFDVAYDQVTGKGFVIYSKDTATTNELAYRTWDGTSWSSEITYDAVRTSGQVAFVKALPRPGSDEIAVIWADDSNMDLSGNYFDMSSGTWSGEPSSALSTNVARIGSGTSINSNFADLAFENVSGDLLVCWGEEGVSDLYCSTRTAGTGGSWGSPSAYTSFAVEAVDMAMASEPGTDYIAYNNMRDATVNAEAAIWDGSNWGNINNYDTSLNSVGASTSNVSVGWLQSGGQSRVVATYDDQLASGIDWLSFNKNSSTWTVESDITGSPAANNFDDQQHLMVQNPHNPAELMFFIRDNNSDMFSREVTFDGSSITWTAVEPGGVAIETNMSNQTTNMGWSLNFAYYAFNSTNVVDGAAAEQGTYHDGSSPAHVFVSDQVGYAFYRDRNNTCVYVKTTDGGVTWSANSPVTVSPSTCFHVAIWYDRWTPGDTTGNYIYIITADGTLSDLRYNRLDVSSDTLLSGGTPTAVTSSPGPALGNGFVSHDNYPSITKATDGKIYAGVHDSDAVGQESYVVSCSASCDTASNWTDTNAAMDEGTTTQAKNYGLLLEPLASGDVMMIVSDVTNNDVLSKVYNSGSSTWDAAWTTIDSNAGFNSTYAGTGISAVVDKLTNNVYLAYTAQATTLGTDDDFRTAVYNGSSWTTKTDILTNDSKGLITPQLAYNQNNGDIYAIYTARTTPATAATANVYWKKSTDGMATWGSEQGPVNSTANDIWGIRANVMSNERIHALWSEGLSSTSEPRMLMGATVADLTIPTYTQSAYRVFANTNTTGVGSAVAALNTSATLTSTQFRLRMLMHASGDGAQPNLEDFKLQFAGKGAGTCAAPSGTPSSYTDVTSGTDIAYYNNSTPSDGASLTTNANDPTHSSDTVRAQTYEEANNFSNSVSRIGGSEDGLWDFSLMTNGVAAGTAYCFRIVKSSGTVLSAYSQYPEIVSPTITNQNPDSPASLAQTKTTNTTISTGNWTNESSLKFSASVSDPDASDTLELCVEKKPLGTPFDSTAVAETCGSGIAYSGTPVTATVTIGSHSEDEYHWQARVKDAAGDYSSWVSYGGNAESARDYGVDTSAPSAGTVYDGSSVGTDAAFNSNSLSSLSVNWSAFNANISGLDHYDYSFGTTPGGTDILSWTSNSTSTSATATGLTLHTSQAYYANVRATDNAGNTTTVTSDGQLVLPSLSFGLSSNSLSFSSLNAGNSYTDTKTTTLTTSTNAYGGYAVRAFITDLLRANASTTIPDFSGGTYASPDSWQNGDVGFGYTSSDTSVQGSNIFQAATCPGGSSLASPGCYAPFSQSKPGDIVADHTASVSGTPLSNQQFTITYRVTTSASQPAASQYSTTVVYSATPVY